MFRRSLELQYIVDLAVMLVLDLWSQFGWLLVVYSTSDRVVTFVIAPVLVAREGESVSTRLCIFTSDLS